MLRLDDAHAEPGGDVFSRVVYAAQSRDVRHVFVNGVALLRDGVDLERADAHVPPEHAEALRLEIRDGEILGLTTARVARRELLTPLARSHSAVQVPLPHLRALSFGSQSPCVQAVVAS